MSDVPYCTCGHLRRAFVCINLDMNDWGCGRCRKPMEQYYDKVIRPREEVMNVHDQRP